MNREQKGILLYFLSLVMLGISFILTFWAFYYRSEFYLYVISCVVFVAFCVLFIISNKIISCEDGYNLIQAYFFYKECLKKGVSSKPENLKVKEIDLIAELVKEHDYSKDFDRDKAKTLYTEGYNTSKIL